MKKTFEAALAVARRLAVEGPRVAAVLQKGKKFEAVPGYMDADDDQIKQIALVTPDGRVWVQEVKQ